ncbi:MAG: LuxR C-terminal-related transcriptional regulator [Clostridiales bacterium]|nr:LuxR C-terminal-related transcriptional regulator [Clostridiales bacterium]
MNSLCPFDNGLAYVMDAQGNQILQKFYNYRKEWSSAYIEYYKHLDVARREKQTTKDGGKPTASVLFFTDWSKVEASEFTRDYILPARKLKYSFYITLVDDDEIARVTFAFDRTRNIPYGEKEREILDIILPHLNNFHRMFYYKALSGTQSAKWDMLLDVAGLTQQERKIVRLLCQGVSPDEISKRLVISPTTIRKHLSHIYKKLSVSGMQELLVKILNPRI